MQNSASALNLTNLQSKLSFCLILNFAKLCNLFDISNIFTSVFSLRASQVRAFWTDQQQEAALAACWTVPAWHCVPSPSSSSPSTLWGPYSAHPTAAQLAIQRPPPITQAGVFLAWTSQVWGGVYPEGDRMMLMRLDCHLEWLLNCLRHVFMRFIINGNSRC